MKHRSIVTSLGLSSVAVACAVACGSSDADNKFQDALDGGSSGASGASGASGGLISSGGSSGASGASGGSSGSSGSSGCATESRKAEKVPVDMVIGLDTSFSMDFDDKWTNVKSALKSFVRNPAYADLGLGLQFFPLRKQCSVTDYGTPAVALTLQPQAADPITLALDAQRMSGGTPMVPLLQGLTTYLKANAKPNRKPLIVLATDGVPDDTCLAAAGGAKANTLDNAVLVATEALAGTPSIPTFVIGVGGELTALNAIAQAGGTSSAILVDTGKNAEAAFLQALDTIRKRAVPCDYAIPFSPVDSNLVNVQYAKGNGTTEGFLFVGTAEGCSKAPSNGWYFDDDKNPKKVVLCAQTCDAVKGDDGARIDVVFGCPRNDVK